MSKGHYSASHSLCKLLVTVALSVEGRGCLAEVPGVLAGGRGEREGVNPPVEVPYSPNPHHGAWPCYSTATCVDDAPLRQTHTTATPAAKPRTLLLGRQHALMPAWWSSLVVSRLDLHLPPHTAELCGIQPSLLKTTNPNQWGNRPTERA